MKKLILIFLLAMSASAWGGAITRTYKVDFLPEEFSYAYNEAGQLRISSSKMHSLPERNEPGLPMLPYEVTLDGQYSYVTSKVSFNKKLIRSNVTVEQSPIPVPTDINEGFSVSNDITYPNLVFPEQNFIFTAQSRWSDFSIFRFVVCPFVYDAKEKNLYFIESFSIEVTASEDDAKSGSTRFGKFPSKMRRAYGLRSEDSANNGENPASVDNNGVDANIEYVIITADSLKQAFEPLLYWKRAKGLKAKIISLEEIYSKYPGSRNPLKIKNCLYDLYKNKGLVYVLLGGDDEVVPVQGCYCRTPKDSVSYYIDDSIPSDIFYSCFDGNFDWDGNGNGIYGELEDNVNFTQYINITRLPIRTESDVSSFISKLLKYEREPDWSNRMLMCGTKLWRYIKDSTQSDAEAKGDNLYTNYIKPYWSGERTRFYDTATDFSGGESYDLTNINLADQLSNGYDFMDMMTHGGQTTWGMEKGASYSSSNGQIQTNIRSSIITTMACHTNAFDKSPYPGSYDPCLSESLIRNPRSGVVAYLGSSRYGWGKDGNNKDGGTAELGPSLKYESSFYKYLFNNELDNLGYGQLVSAAKNSMSMYCYYYHCARWLQLSLNPIGDPEMPIFIEQPKAFLDIEFDQTAENISIKTGASGCRICVMSVPDSGESYHKVYDNVENITIGEFPVSYSICVTKQGYIPAVYYLSYDSGNCKWIIQNEKLSGKNSYTMDDVEIGSKITNNLPKGSVEINSGTTEITAKSVTIRPEFSVKKGAELNIKNK